MEGALPWTRRSLCELIDSIDGGKVLVHDFAGCGAEYLLGRVGLKMADLFFDSPVNGNGNHSRSKHRITVDELACDKKLPAEFLRSLGLKDTARGVDIPYPLADGSLAPRHMIRYGLKANGGSCWDDNEGPVVPYGLDKLAEAREAGFVCLVEGNSDCWTLRYHGFPALGIPGASMTSKLEASHVAGISKLYIIREPDGGGASFVHGLAGRLAEIGWKGSAFVVLLGLFKDPNELHKSKPETFRENFQKALMPPIR